MMRTHNLSLGPPSPALSPRAGSTWGSQNLSLGPHAPGQTPSFPNSASGLRTPSGFEHLDFGADYFSLGERAQKKAPRSFEWEYWADWDQARTPELSPSPSPPVSPSRFAPSAPNPPSPSPGRLEVQQSLPPVSIKANDVLKRRLGPNEISYYLGSRGASPLDPLAGVNDMYLHVGFKAPSNLVTPARVAEIWTELRLRHTLLASFVEYESFEDIRFVYKPPTTFDSALEQAKQTLTFKYGVEKDAVLDRYLNGDRTLNDDKLAALMITSATKKDELRPDDDAEQLVEYDFWLFATHFLGDGMALHTTANEFFGLLGGELETAKAENKGLEWDVETGAIPLPPLSRLPPAMETRIATPESWPRLAWAAARVEFQRNQGQLIGGQTFPRAKMGGRRTVVPTHAFTTEETSAILKTCKKNGVTIAHAIFALSNLAHIRVTENDSDGLWTRGKDKALPTMLYSALNLRPNMIKGPEEDKGIKPDFFHLVIGYYNVILPSFQPTGLTAAQTFWHRCRETKAQTLKAIKSPWLTQRSKLMSLERGRRAIGFEREDERRRREKAAKNAGLPTIGLGFGVPMSAPAVVLDGESPVTALVEEKKVVVPAAPEVPATPGNKTEPAPSLALLGVSMLGNLDGMYKHASFPKLKLHTLTTGSRQRPGAMLMFAYTLAGRLFVSLGYDANGYPDGVVEGFYDELLKGVDQFLIQG